VAHQVTAAQAAAVGSGEHLADRGAEQRVAGPQRRHRRAGHPAADEGAQRREHLEEQVADQYLIGARLGDRDAGDGEVLGAGQSLGQGSEPHQAAGRVRHVSLLKIGR
jgi:hypothetical protein